MAAKSKEPQHTVIIHMVNNQTITATVDNEEAALRLRVSVMDAVKAGVSLTVGDTSINAHHITHVTYEYS